MASFMAYQAKWLCDKGCIMRGYDVQMIMCASRWSGEYSLYTNLSRCNPKQLGGGGDGTLIFVAPQIRRSEIFLSPWHCSINITYKRVFIACMSSHVNKLSAMYVSITLTPVVALYLTHSHPNLVSFLRFLLTAMLLFVTFSFSCRWLMWQFCICTSTHTRISHNRLCIIQTRDSLLA